jgi:hypothetical protein
MESCSCDRWCSNSQCLRSELSHQSRSVANKQETYPEELVGHAVHVPVRHYVLESSTRLGLNSMLRLEMLSDKERPSLIDAFRIILTLSAMISRGSQEEIGMIISQQRVSRQ